MVRRGRGLDRVDRCRIGQNRETRASASAHPRVQSEITPQPLEQRHQRHRVRGERGEGERALHQVTLDDAVEQLLPALALCKKAKAVALVSGSPDKARQIAAQYGIMSIPTLLIFKNGQIVDKHVGVASKGDLKKKIEAAMA